MGDVWRMVEGCMMRGVVRVKSIIFMNRDIWREVLGKGKEYLAWTWSRGCWIHMGVHFGVLGILYIMKDEMCRESVKIPGRR